jgi:hypothetical protein
MQVLDKLNNSNGEFSAYMFWCPGCGCYHSFDIKRWKFNGNFEQPTFEPSLLITMPNDPNYRCHLFVRDGKIEYCSDSLHKFAGQTIQMWSTDIDERYEQRAIDNA